MPGPDDFPPAGCSRGGGNISPAAPYMGVRIFWRSANDENLFPFRPVPGADGRPGRRGGQPHPPRPGGAVQAVQRADGLPAGGPLPAPGVGQHQLHGGLQEREARQDRLRPPLRAHDVPGLQALQRRLLQAPAGRGLPGQRRHQHRPHPLLGTGPGGLPGARPVDGGRPHGLPAGRHDPGAPVQPDLRRPERAAPELREPTLWNAPGKGGRPGLPHQPPVQLDHHRLHGRPAVLDHRRREGFLQVLLHPQQRQPLHHRRLQEGRSQGSCAEVFRRHPARASGDQAGRVGAAAERAGGAVHAGPGAAAAHHHLLAHAEALLRGRGGPHRLRPDPGRREDLPALQGADL